ncbi:hypothetical protein [Roseimicrobium sp. ORNL1]|uniref:hypothetical protein n=1 Tax=Roseimicrobium sp. ORNL1 TaxID=2711231 RepID=UPI0013E1F682|nr:hypothetical protein [Roseimicrobium sp. ORNL1]QIF01966.1 hypothetical protein G5S37_10635 [Roseimicrobium sp. ORNL1]
MSRRTKLIITALFLVLLAIPVVYAVLTWRPQNPLRFRQLGESVLRDETGKVYYSRKLLEVRNISVAPVLCLSGTYSWESPEGEGTFFASWSLGGSTIEERFIPPGGAIQIELDPPNLMPAEYSKHRQAGEQRSGEGRVHYRWGSRVQASTSSACLWISEKLPESMWNLVPHLDPFEDEIDMDLSPPP